MNLFYYCVGYVIIYMVIHMQELTNDLFYKEYSSYIDASIDYAIVKSNKLYNDLESHKEAFIYAINKWSKELGIDINTNIDSMNAKEILVKDFFFDKKYYRFFLKQPYGTPFQRIDLSTQELYREIYTMDDINKLNNILFPNGLDNLVIYEWNPKDFSYFESGLEWWGTISVSIYDKSLDRFVIICSSTTD